MPQVDFTTKTITLREGETKQSALKTINQRFPKSFPSTGSGTVSGKPRKPNFAKFKFVRGTDENLAVAGFVRTTVVDPSTTRLQRRELLRQGKPVPTIEVNLPRRKKTLDQGGVPDIPLRPFGSQKVGFLTARDESGKETFRSKPFSIEPDRRTQSEFGFDPIVTFGSVLGDPTVSRKRRSKIKGKNGKKKKKAKPKPLKSIFDLSF